MAAKHAETISDQSAVMALAANMKNRLGKLSEPYRLDVRHLWNDRFRVNVCVGIVSITIPYSYFIIADAQGNIVSSTPEIPLKR